MARELERVKESEAAKEKALKEMQTDSELNMEVRRLRDELAEANAAAGGVAELREEVA